VLGLWVETEGLEVATGGFRVTAQVGVGDPWAHGRWEMEGKGEKRRRTGVININWHHFHTPLSWLVERKWW